MKVQSRTTLDQKMLPIKNEKFPNNKSEKKKKNRKKKTWPDSQVDGMVMGYRLGSNLANNFLWHHESN